MKTRTEGKKQKLEDWQMKSCRSAARQLYKKGGFGQPWKDLCQDAYLVALSPRHGRPPQNGGEFYWKVYCGLIDMYRKVTRYRWLKKHNKQLRFYSLDVQEENSKDKVNNRAIAIIKFLEKKQAAEWNDEDEDRTLDFWPDNTRRSISESTLHKIIKRHLRDETMRLLVKLVYWDGLNSKEAGEIVGKSPQTVINKLARFRAAVKRDILNCEE